jgi:hypothetical protein
MKTFILFLVFALVIIPIGRALSAAAIRRGDRMIAHWAAENRLKLIDVKHCQSPFKSFYGPGGTSNIQSLYQVSARDESERTIEGWLRLGGVSIGLFSNRIDFYPEAKKASSIDDWSARTDA